MDITHLAAESSLSSTTSSTATSVVGTNLAQKLIVTHSLH
jgi:hypothetical protein